MVHLARWTLPQKDDKARFVVFRKVIPTLIGVLRSLQPHFVLTMTFSEKRMVRFGFSINPEPRGQQAAAADGAIAWFSSNFFPFELGCTESRAAAEGQQRYVAFLSLGIRFMSGCSTRYLDGASL